MHELGIAENLSVIVLETAARENLSKVSRVNVTFGQMVQIEPSIFEFAFIETIRNSIAEGAELEIEIVPVKMRCTVCGSDFEVTDNRFSCMICHSTELEIIHGTELFIKSIEGE